MSNPGPNNPNQIPFMIPMYPFNPYCFYQPIQMPVQPTEQVMPQSMIEQPVSGTKKYKRVWKRGEIKKLYDYAQNYAV
jgi:hypothetical protein